MSRDKIRPLLLASALACLSLPAGAAPQLELAFPGPAETTATRAEPLTSFRLPVGPFENGSLQTQLTEGTLDQTAFRITLPQPSTLELMQALRGQVTGAGFDVLYECETEACGGFDFRYGTDLLPEPDMHVDLGDFRYLAASRKAKGGEEFVSLVVSRSVESGYVQVTRIGAGEDAGKPVLTTATKSPDLTVAEPKALSLTVPETPAPSVSDLGKALDLGQSKVLEDLVFASGSSGLQAGDYASLSALADWLKADSKRRVTLVGHTDASGGLAGNIKLSRLRAESVRQVLLFAHKVPPAQVTAEGVGYLAPRDTNQTEEGRRKNRRVEVMPTSTELP